MKTKNLLMLLAIAGIMVFASCKKDDSISTLTKEEATAALNAVNNDYSTSMDDFESSTGNQILYEIEYLGLDFINGVKKVSLKPEILQNDIQKALSPSSATKGDDIFLDFNFTENVGTWRKVNGLWKCTPDPTNKIVVIFSYNGGVDNGTLTYFNYEEKEYESMPYISSLSCKVELVGSANPVASWNYTASMSGSLSSVNMSMKVVKTLGIYSETDLFSVEGNKAGATVSVSSEIKKNSEILVAVSYSMKLTGNQTDYNIIVDASYRIKDIIVKWAINMNKNTNFSGNPGDFQTISVWTADGSKVADVIYRSEAGKWVSYFKFADGTETPVHEILKGSLLEDDLKQFGEVIKQFPNLGVK